MLMISQRFYERENLMESNGIGIYAQTQSQIKAIFNDRLKEERKTRSLSSSRFMIGITNGPLNTALTSSQKKTFKWRENECT